MEQEVKEERGTDRRRKRGSEAGRAFPGGPVSKTESFQCRGPELSL